MRPFLLLTALLFLASCKKDTKKAVPGCVYECEKMPIGIQIDPEFYTPEEMDTVIIKKYAADGMFSPVQSESIVVINDTGQYEEKNPIVYMSVYAGNDYEIVVPGTGQTYRIQGIVQPFKSYTFTDDACASGHFQCTVPTKDCTVSGGNYTIDFYDMTTIILKH